MSPAHLALMVYLPGDVHVHIISKLPSGPDVCVTRVFHEASFDVDSMVTVVEWAGNIDPKILTGLPAVVDEESRKQVIRLVPEGNPVTLNETDRLVAPV